MLPLIIYKTFRRSINFRERINENSKETNLEIVLNILKNDLGIKKIQIGDKLINADSKMSSTSFGEHITVVVDDNRILYNCWSKLGIWSMHASEIYWTFDEKLEESGSKRNTTANSK